MKGRKRSGARRTDGRPRIMTFCEAIREALAVAMAKDPAVFVMGIGVDDHKAVFGSTRGLADRFGKDRVFDTPISEAAMTGVAVGAALGGLKPVHVHIRCDFLYLAMDQLFNVAAKWQYMFGGQMRVPIVIRCVIGRSWGQGAQHSQSLQSFFMHVPGFKVAMPTTAYDAQGLLLAALSDPNPVLLIEHRLLYDIPGRVPRTLGPIPFGRAEIRRRGNDATVVAPSYMAVEALKAAEFLARHGVQVEVIDPVSLVPLDEETILRSVRKTGRLLVVDTSWVTCGLAAEIAALAAEKAVASLKGPVRRLGMKSTTCPVSKPLERLFYADAPKIAREVFSMLGREFPKDRVETLATAFKGPF